ncbi:hypothetical protein BJX70DRAFT_371373 [Aspergillus crustosus]
MGSDEHISKRTKVRKGTHSCRECRRRKVKCIFASPSDSICIICRRRGTQCISQGDEIPFDARFTPIDEVNLISPPPALTLQSNLVIDQEYAHDHQHDESTTVLPPTPASSRTFHTERTPHSAITESLLRALPLRNDIEILTKRISRISTYCYQSNIKAHIEKLDTMPKDQIPMASLLFPESHPVLLARQMLLFAAGLQHVASNAAIPGLTEHHHHIMEELAESAIKLVTTNDALLGSLEGLETIILEGFYHVDSGNIRRSWITMRRAVMAGQLLGLHQPGHYRFKVISEKSDLDPEVIWACIISMERVLSILLGLPSSTIPSHPQPKDPLQITFTQPQQPQQPLTLSSICTDLAGHILERNLISNPDASRTRTAEIDRDLITQTAHLPAAFWRPLSFANLEPDSAAAFWETRRAWDHMCYYTLVNQLHLPFILCPSHEPYVIYSRLACVNASREILTREIAIRTFNPMTACSRISDFLALVAGMTLILSHLISHSRKEDEKLLIHQRLGDRATVEQALECMKSMSEVHEDVLAARCATLLKDLLDIEANAARGVLASDVLASDCGGACGLVINVPFIGAIKITSEGISPIAPESCPRAVEMERGGLPNEGVTIGGIGSIHLKGPKSSAELDSSSSTDTSASAVNAAAPEVPVQAQAQAPATTVNPMLFPDAAASMDDWVFQGFDTAFFDVLMRGVGEHQLDGSGVGTGTGSGDADGGDADGGDVEGWDLGTYT